MKQSINEIQIQVESLTINNDDELVYANEIAKKINSGIKEIKDSYKAIKDATNKAHKVAVDMEKQALEPWEKSKKLLKSAIGNYMTLVEEKRKKEIELQKEAEELFGVTIPTEEKPKLGGTHLREVWEVEITDPDAVPIKYGNVVIRDINVKALKDIAKFEDGKAQIDGVKFYKKKVTVIR